MNNDNKQVATNKTSESIIKSKEPLNDITLKYRIIFEQSPIAIELYDETGLLLNANPACLELFGIKDLKEIIKFSLFDDPNIPKDHKDDLKNGKLIRYEACFDFNKVKESHLYNTSKSGHLFLDVMITPIKDNDIINGYLLQIQDITARKLAEENESKISGSMINRELKMVELKEEIKKLMNRVTELEDKK